MAGDGVPECLTKNGLTRDHAIAWLKPRASKAGM